MTAATQVRSIEVFRPGTFKGSDGTSYTLTAEQLQQAADAYDPAISQAPIVVGHPRHDAPAYGWVEKMLFRDGRLQAQPIQVEPKFAEMVNAGRFKRISVCFYGPNSPNNPKPGIWYPKHIGFLGAAAPMVPGLKAVEFSEGEQGIIEFADMPLRWYYGIAARLFRRLRDYYIETLGLEKADKVLSEWDVAELETAAVKEAAADSPAFAESEAPAAISEEDKAKLARFADLEAENARLKSEAAARTAEFAEQETQRKAAAEVARKTEIVEFCDGLVTQGRLLPKDKAATIEMIARLPEGEIEFAEGDAQVKKPVAEWVRTFLAGLPVQVDFAERGGARPGQELDLNSADAISKRALEFQESETKAGRTVSIAASVQHVTTGATV